jgi:flagellar assembly protein FliH
VTYLSRFERRGMQRGLEQGMGQGLEQGLAQGLEQGQIATARAAIVEVLATRFEKVPNKVAGRLNKIGDANTLRGLLRKAVMASTLKDFERQLNP